jgi:hypothetical protein
MSDIGDQLSAWGEAWRSTQPAYDGHALEGSRATVRSRQTMGAAALLVAGAIVLAVLALRRGPLAVDESFAGAGNTGVVKPGDLVIASGDLVQTTNGSYVICLPAARDRLMSTTALRCSTSFPAIGIDARSVPGWTTTNGVSYAPDVTVRGAWTGSAITVASLTQTLPSVLAPSPCGPAPSARAAPSGIDAESALRPVDAEVASHPDVYGGLWSGTIDGDRVIPVVGALNAQSAQAALAQIYPYQLCVIQVQRSVTQLSSLLTQVAQAHPDWIPEADLPHNRIAVTVGVLDAATASELQQYSTTVYVNAFVHLAN